jgi:uncharacterized RDD family membrane protein YckC
MDEKSTKGAPAAGLTRRLAALLYDTILLLAWLFVGTLPILPLTGGEAITPAAQHAGAYLYRGYLALLALGFFGFPWTRGGQTLGMKTWNIRLESRDGSPPGWGAAALRFALGLALALAALCGLWLARAPGWSAKDFAAAALVAPALANHAWIVLDRRGRSLQDIVCGMRVIRLC